MHFIGQQKTIRRDPRERVVCHGGSRPAWVLSWLLLIVLLGGCSRGSGAATTADLQTRTGADPMNAVEAYLQQYQPGPQPRLFQTTHLYDRNGELLAELIDEGYRTWVAIDQVARPLIDATVATEDATFFGNSGVDPLRMVGAAVRSAQEGEITSGASTITMQLARNLFLGPEQRYNQSVDRKLLEVGVAQELTQLYSKAELLEMYLNLLNYGNLAYGPQAAARLYFGKDVADLTLAEASMLAGIPQQPANLDPYRNPDAVKRRQRIVLDLMVRHGYLTTAAADAAFAEPLSLQPQRTALPNRAPHFVQYVVESLDRRFGNGYTKRAGLEITTTLDLPLQVMAQQLVAERVAAAQPVYDLSNAALVAMRPGSGELLVMVGSADFDNPAIAGQVNVALSLRQPGSAIKPVLYAAALDRNLISPATVLWDTPITYTLSADQIYAPHNYDNQFHGPVTARSALANSYNVPTVKLLDALSVATMLETARAMGIRSLNQPPDWYGLSLTLGGGEVTLLELTTAFHTLASEGAYLPPQPILRTADALGRPVFPLEAVAPIPALTPATAFLISDMLSDNTARTPAFGTTSPLELSRPAAVKTGTTTDFRDNWTIGYTRYLVVGVWAGNSDGHPMQNTSGVIGAAPIWHEFMERVIADPTALATLQAPTEAAAWVFTPPAGVEQRPDCPPGVSCRADGEYFSTAWLQTTGAAGPLVDSVEAAATAPVYVQQGESGRRVGFCTLADAATRTVLRMPDPVGFAQLPAHLTSTGPAGFLTAQTITVTETVSPLTDSQLQTVAWALRNSSALNLGPCDRLQELVPAAVAAQPGADTGLRVLVDVAAAGNPEVAAVAGDGSVDIGALQSATAVETGLIGAGYGLAAPVVHNNECPGQYVMGRIVNGAGAPIAGVAVKMRDQWGNETVAVSKSGAIDFGLFDFPIPSGAPHELYLTVLGEGGAPASATVTIFHRQGEGGDFSCHHVVFQSR
jgi:penicillin-binding protein 1C